ncbi:hypothetical protein BN439_0058 [Erwinia amylovora Ea644]|uniref:Uncharacterized protein n=1 Tax=Erwinia amylovora ATCC BAA-2158 TaxID=889211 RepID=E5B076_ERWAM|nr:hypothetical protein predicted by Glimmer/Critica [Erwinia amylovora ATCC BAA-2158]CCO88278.1 hypothetical protein BN435_0055 [Erwinia amylovora 01SFR-BO]CCO97389.1 hypothetical protein BN438_0056 [Erwinia amylovora UPN527]CCP01166.1 hypothetical protein BN439_0058 [Erwinia amylovora Ea644]CCP05139.1 hypothetical protein BN440_0073 [Erwinia amylovora MR1]
MLLYLLQTACHLMLDGIIMFNSLCIFSGYS